MNFVLLVIAIATICILFKIGIDLADKCDRLMEDLEKSQTESLDAWKLNQEYAKKVALIMQLEREGELDMTSLEIIQGELMSAYRRTVEKGKGDGK